MRRSYDTIAIFYDPLAKLIYGKALIQARSYLLQVIQPGAHILMVGGGTGWELEEITKKYPSGITITYIDASAKMVAIAAKRNIGANTISFIAAPIENTVLSDNYDIVITPFFFDNFTDEGMNSVFSSIHSHLKPRGLWLYCDFQNTKVLWQKAVLKVMYTFFRVCCGIAAKQLPDAAACFTNHGYTVRKQKKILHDFIAAVIYEKPI